MSFTVERKEIIVNNRKSVQHLLLFSSGLGINFAFSQSLKYPLRFLSVIIITCGFLSLYGHWGLYAHQKYTTPQLVESICTALQTTMGIIKTLNILLKERQCQRLLEEALSHGILEQSEIFTKDKSVKRRLRLKINEIMCKIWEETRIQTVIFSFLCVALTFQYIFGAVVKNLYHELKQTPNYEHVLPFPAYYPIWEDEGMTFPYYHLQMFLSSISVYICGLGSLVVDGFFVVLCLYSVGLVRSFKVIIDESTSPLLTPKQGSEYLRCCVLQYQRIYEYVKEIDQIYEHVTLTQLFFALAINGIVLYMLSVGLETDATTILRMLLYIATNSMQTILYNFNAQRLTTANDEIPLALYNCKWYNYSKEFKFLLRMMIMRTNRPLYLRLSAFSKMSHETLLTFFRTSGSYFLLLRNVIEN